MRCLPAGCSKHIAKPRRSVLQLTFDWLTLQLDVYAFPLLPHDRRRPHLNSSRPSDRRRTASVICFCSGGAPACEPPSHPHGWLHVSIPFRVIQLPPQPVYECIRVVVLPAVSYSSPPSSRFEPQCHGSQRRLDSLQKSSPSSSVTQETRELGTASSCPARNTTRLQYPTYTQTWSYRRRGRSDASPRPHSWPAATVGVLVSTGLSYDCRV